MPSKSRRRSTPRTRTQTQKKSRVEKRRRNQSRSRPRSRRSVAQRKKSGSRSRRNLRGGLLSQQQQQEQRTARGKGVSPGDWVAGTAAVLGTGAGLYALQQRRNALKAEEVRQTAISAKEEAESARDLAQTARKEAVKARSFASIKNAATRILSGKKAEKAKEEAREANERADAAEQRAAVAEERARLAEGVAAQNAPQQTAQETEFTRKLLDLPREDLNAFETCVIQNRNKSVLLTDSEVIFDCLRNSQSTTELLNEFKDICKTFDGHKILRKVVEFDFDTAFDAQQRDLQENPQTKIQFLAKWKTFQVRNFFVLQTLITPILKVTMPNTYYATFIEKLTSLKNSVLVELKRHESTLKTNLESYITKLPLSTRVKLEENLLKKMYKSMLELLLNLESLNVIENDENIKTQIQEALTYFNTFENTDLTQTNVVDILPKVFYKVDGDLWLTEVKKLNLKGQELQKLATYLSNFQENFVPHEVFFDSMPVLKQIDELRLPLLLSTKLTGAEYLGPIVSELFNRATRPRSLSPQQAQ